METFGVFIASKMETFGVFFISFMVVTLITVFMIGWFVTTTKAMKDADAGRTHKAASVDKLFSELL